MIRTIGDLIAELQKWPPTGLVSVALIPAPCYYKRELCTANQFVMTTWIALAGTWLGLAVVARMWWLLEGIMAKIDDLRAKLDEIDVTTTEIAGDLDEVIGKLEGGVTDVEADELIARLTVHSETLKGIAAKVPEPEEPGPES